MAARNIKGITVEIGGDTTGLQKALQGVNKEIKDTQSQLRDVEKLLKMDPGNTELLVQKQKLLNDAVSETKSKLTALKTASEQANTALANGEITQSQYDALQREITETEQKLKSLEKQAESSAVSLQKIAATGDKLKSVGSSISNVGTALAPVSAAAAAAGVAGVKAATDWETAFTGVKKTVDATEAEYEELGEGIQQMATETASSMEDIAGVAEVAGQLGIAKEDLLDFTRVMVELGDTTNISAEDAATSLARFLNITGESTSNVDRLGAAIVDLGNNFATDEASIVAMSTRLASAGTLAGLTSTDILALSTAMSSVGIEAEAGGTAMTQTLTSIESAVADFSAGSTGNLEKIASVANMSASDFASAWNTHPIEAVQAFITGLGTLDEKGESATLVLDELGMSGIRQSNMLKSLALASDVLSEAIGTSSTAYAENTALTAEAEKRYGTFASQVSQLKESLKTIAIDIGQTLIPILQNLMEKLKGVVDWWKNLSDGQRTLIVDIGLFVAALSPVLIVIGKVVSAVGSIMTIIPKIAPALSAVKVAFAGLNAVMAANPIILIIAAVAALVAAFVYLWNNCEKFRQFWINLWENIKTIAITVWNAISTFLVTLWNGIVTVATTIWNGIATFFTNLWMGISTTVQTVVNAISEFLAGAWATISGGVSAAWTAIAGFFTGIWTSISSFISTTATNIWNTLTGIWSNILSTVSSIVGTLASVISSVFSNIWSGIASTVSNIYNTIASGFNNAVSFIQNLVSQAFSWGADLIGNIVDGIWSAIGAVGDAVSNVASTIWSYLHFSVPEVGPLTDFESWMPDFMKGLAQGIEKSRSLVEKAVVGVAADLVINPKAAHAAEGAGSSTKSLVQHTGTIRIEGVGDDGTFSSVVDVVIDRLREEVRT